MLTTRLNRASAQTKNLGDSFADSFLVDDVGELGARPIVRGPPHDRMVGDLAVNALVGVLHGAAAAATTGPSGDRGLARLRGGVGRGQVVGDGSDPPRDGAHPLVRRIRHWRRREVEAGSSK